MILIWSSYLLTGILSSFLAGLLGVGGGLIIIPALAFIFSHFNIFASQNFMPIVIATSLASSITNLTSAVITHNKKGNVRWNILRQMSLGIFIGALFLGPFILSFLSGEHLSTIFGIACFFFSVQMFFPLKKISSEEHLPHKIILFSFALFIGTFSTLLGLAGGVMIGTLLTYYAMDMRKVIGTTAAIALLLSIAGTIGLMIIGGQTRYSLPEGCVGFIYLPALIGIVIPSPFFVILGAKVAQKLPVSTLKKLFATLILLVGIKMLI